MVEVVVLQNDQDLLDDEMEVVLLVVVVENVAHRGMNVNVVVEVVDYQIDSDDDYYDCDEEVVGVVDKDYYTYLDLPS